MRLKGSSGELDVRFPARIELHPDDIEPHGNLVEPLPRQVSPRQQDDLPLFAPIDRRQRASEVIAPAGLDLDKDEDGPVPRYDIDLAETAPSSSLNDAVSPPLELATREILTVAAKAFGIPDGAPPRDGVSEPVHETMPPE
jgi:hypothetical protein